MFEDLLFAPAQPHQIRKGDALVARVDADEIVGESGYRLGAGERAAGGRQNARGDRLGEALLLGLERVGSCPIGQAFAAGREQG